MLDQARRSFAELSAPEKARKTRLDVRVFGSAGAPLKVVATADGEQISVRGQVPLAAARAHSLDATRLREQLGRLGETPFALGDIDVAGLPDGLFLPLSEINHIRQEIVAELMTRRDWAAAAREAERRANIAACTLRA